LAPEYAGNQAGRCHYLALEWLFLFFNLLKILLFICRLWTPLDFQVLIFISASLGRYWHYLFGLKTGFRHHWRQGNVVMRYGVLNFCYG